MKTSQNGIELIKKFEGLELESYPDIAGIWTIGYGQTGPTIGPDQSITEAEAEALLIADLTKRERAILRLVRVPLSSNQFSALVSFVYNVGVGAFGRSTLLKNLNAYDYKGAAAEFEKWNKATIMGVKTEVAGLTRRRRAEKTLFETPDFNPDFETPNNPQSAHYISEQDTRITPIPELRPWDRVMKKLRQWWLKVKKGL